MENINAIPVFVTVVEQKGFAAAARQLGVSKSAVSKRISLLEEHLGARLLHRSTRNISLTEAGELYYARAVDALAAAQEAESAVAQLQGKPKGRLKINVPMTFGRLHIAPLIPKFLKNNPEISIDMIMDDRLVDLVDGGFDLAIRGGRLQDSSLIARKIAPCRNVLAASPGYLDEFGMPENPEDLHHHNCLHYAYFSDQQEWTLEGADGPIKIEASGNFQVNNGDALTVAVLGGCGIGRLTTFAAGDYLRSGELRQVLPEYTLPTQNMYAVYPARQYLPTKTRSFIDFISSEIGGDEPYWDEGLYPSSLSTSNTR
ncbi:LysR family transcriptional regulator [Pseudovibrio sp. Alg231-02]|uniref:LysR family transcriptional regulator n=1 Tax=Pseudovibrio sp. Alg231-02 TaxID=1922223 RepID=UPI000D5592B2|nr:LysR family transcriptional regulator [Pseudovibrio sp. Alg231-02]